jgi:site-specific recombinase XerD
MARNVRDWKAYQQTSEKVAPAVVNQRLVALSRFFTWAIQKDLSKEDPTTDVLALRLPPRDPKALSSQDVRRLLRAAHHHPRDFALLEVLIGTGIRVGELLGAVLLADALIYILSELHFDRRHYVEVSALAGLTIDALRSNYKQPG